jgi:hypothetical protein
MKKVVLLLIQLCQHALWNRPHVFVYGWVVLIWLVLSIAWFSLMHGTQWLVADAGLQSVPHQQHGITGWFKLCKSSVWSIIQGLYMVERYRLSCQCQFLFISLLDTAIYQPVMAIEMTPWEPFCMNSKSMSLLPTCSRTQLLQCEWLEGLWMGMWSRVMCIHVSICVATLLCQLQEHPKSHFAWTSRVITLLPTCSHDLQPYSFVICEGTGGLGNARLWPCCFLMENLGKLWHPATDLKKSGETPLMVQ